MTHLVWRAVTLSIVVAYVIAESAWATINRESIEACVELQHGDVEAAVE